MVSKRWAQAGIALLVAGAAIGAACGGDEAKATPTPKATAKATAPAATPKAATPAATPKAATPAATPKATATAPAKN